MAKGFRSNLLRVHRWLSLAALVFWLLQAISGALIVFHWEINDLTIPGDHRALDLDGLDRRVKQLAPPGSGRTVDSIWTSAGLADRFDIIVVAEAPQVGETVRVDGAGDVLRVRKDGEQWADGGWVGTLVSFHHDLLGGDTGSWVVGVSGLLLLSNIGMGLVVAWPRRGTWRRTLMPPRAGPLAARRYAWHRAIGLWVAVPALFSVAAGVMLVFTGTVDKIVQPSSWGIDPVPASGPLSVGMPDAVRTAMRLYPGSKLVAVSYPTPENAVYRVRFRQPGDDARAYGHTAVFVDAVEGQVIGNLDIFEAPPARRFVNGLFAFHTGEFGGLTGRILVMLIGIGLVTMVVLGFQLWRARRKPRKAPEKAAEES